jgi:hypothetical protein
VEILAGAAWPQRNVILPRLANVTYRHILRLPKFCTRASWTTLLFPASTHSIAVLETEVLGLRFLNDVNQSAESFSLASTSGLLMNADE